MTRIIDLGNGYGRVEGYGSEYASLTFPLNTYAIRQLHVEGHINDKGATDALIMVGFEPRAASWLVTLDNIDLVQIGRKFYGHRTI